MNMKVSLRGLLLHAANCLDQLEREYTHSLEENGEEDDRTVGGDYYAHCLREVVEHIKEVHDGTGTLEEFADLYCLDLKAEPTR